MRWWDKIRMRVRMLFGRARESERLDRELQFHLDQQIAENVAAGMSKEEARCAALRLFGNPALLREQSRETWSWNWMERLAQDIRFALRQIGRAPGFALVAILTLGLGIGANTAIFSLTHALLLESLPVPEPGQLVRIALDVHMSDHPGASNLPLSLPMIEMLRERAHAFAGIFGWSVYDFVLKDGGDSHGRRGAMVSGNAFQVLGLRAAAGRLLEPADDQPGGGPDGWAAVISYRLWVEQYHGDPSAIGRHVEVTDHGATIVGVAPPGFEGVVIAEHPDLYLPVEFSAAINSNEANLHSGMSNWLTAFARLKPGASRQQAQAEVNTLLPAIKLATVSPAMRSLPQVQRATLDVDSARTGWSPLRLGFTRPMVLLQILVGVVLLVCCANLSGLFLARAAARQQEFAIRGALGARRGRVMRQLLVESLMLAVPGALVGTGLAWLAGPWLLHGLGNSEAEISLSVRPDWTVLSITAGCACLCAVLFGMAPAWIASRTRLEKMLRSGRGTSRGGSAVARRILIPLQLALSVSLIVVAALLGSTVVHLRTDSTGYRAKNVVFYIADFWRLPQKGADLVSLYRRILRGMEAQPGVESASVVEILPFYGWVYNDPFTAAADARHATTVQADVNEIGAHYFATVGTRLLAGRDFRDDDGDVHSCVINERAAGQYFKGGSALGKWLHQVSLDPETGVTTVRDCQIVGIAENSKYDTVRETPPAIVYLPITADTLHLPGLFFTIHARSYDAASAAYHKVIHDTAPLSPETDPATLEKLMSDSMAREQLLSALSGFFAGLALLLSGIGIYGLVAWNVSQRIPEIGMRMALGATRLRVFLLVVRQIVVLLLIGLAGGGVAAFFAARSVSSFLYEIPASSPAVYLLAGAVLACIGLLAACIPARHAVQIDPMDALRTE